MARCRERTMTSQPALAATSARPAPMIPDPRMPTRLMTVPAMGGCYRSVGFAGSRAAGTGCGHVTDDHTAGVHGHLWAIVPKPSVDTLILVSTIAPDRLPDRLVALEAVHNFRDLGGYTTIDGRVTRWQTLYRADGLHRLTTADVEALRALGLHTVVDLRTDRELDERGTFPVDAYPVTFHHLPVIDVTWDPNTGDESDPAEFLFHQYESLLAYGEPLFAKAFHLLGLPGALPAVFHCRGRQGPHRHPRRADPVRPRRAPRRRDRGLRPVPQRHGPDARVGHGPQP